MEWISVDDRLPEKQKFVLVYDEDQGIQLAVMLRQRTSRVLHPSLSLFLASGFTAIGLFASVLSSNQIVSFIIGVALSFALYYGFQALGDLEILPELTLENWGMSARYRAMGRGVIDTRDVLYFLSISFVFLYLTKNKFEQK